ncbi:hypothetical protein [Bifidobacterium angulatum]|uniref:hypothetical protein n=1 Tax=Bifidobacterium angulatum TaxID=1683 RepID=UPI0021C33429|nr:hypothetical protein [Bifidobacterium angulatum]
MMNVIMPKLNGNRRLSTYGTLEICDVPISPLVISAMAKELITTPQAKQAKRLRYDSPTLPFHLQLGKAQRKKPSRHSPAWPHCETQHENHPHKEVNHYQFQFGNDA